MATYYYISDNCNNIHTGKPFSTTFELKEPQNGPLLRRLNTDFFPIYVLHFSQSLCYYHRVSVGVIVGLSVSNVDS